MKKKTSSFFLCYLSILRLLHGVAATAGGTSEISLGSTLTATSSSSSWSSPNNTFSLTFISDPHNPSLFLASITYSGGLSIWTPTGSVDSGGTLRLQSDGNLLLSNSSGATIWDSGTSNLGVTSASLTDSGNLQLIRNNKNTDSILWQSFDHPTDTILESQKLSFGQTLRSDPYYSFSLLRSGNLTLKWNNTVTYYNKKSLNSSSSSSSLDSNVTLDSPTLLLQNNGILTLLDSTLPSFVVIAYSSNYGESGDMLRFLRLDTDGNLRAYSVPRGASAIATPQWSAVADQCQVFGWCGNFGICSYNDSSPICSCPSDNFLPIDPNDTTKGCRRKTEIQDCAENSTMIELDNTQFLTYPPQLSTERFFVEITACRLNCLAGGSCIASTSLADGSGLCYFKVSSFVSGYHSPSLPSTSFVRVCPPAEQPFPTPSPSSQHSPAGSSKLKAWVVAAVVTATILCLIVIETLFWWLCCGPKFKPSSVQYALLEYASGAPVQFSYRELQRATKGFKEKLGSGGFGAVYRGVLANNRTAVAVKQLEGIEQGERQFRMEVATISSTHHLNLVRLFGFCSEGKHRLLVYEFMKNGSLDTFIFNSSSSGKQQQQLNWAARYRIAVGTARGITYLHEECRDCIVHCDIKPENILLDDNFNAKVSDFGLAKLITVRDQRSLTTTLRGTRGYLAPEWLANSPVTSKSDVYSYGMVLLEIIGGRRNFEVSPEEEGMGGKKFWAWAYSELFEKGNIKGIIDKRLHESELDMEQVERAVYTSFWCIQEQPSARPSIGKVIQMLEGIVEVGKPPHPKSAVTSSSAPSIVESTFIASGPNPSSSTSFQGRLSSLSISMNNQEKKKEDLLN